MLKKLHALSCDDIQKNVFINTDLTPLERQHRSALREELKLRIAAWERDIAIRPDKIIRINKS